MLKVDFHTHIISEDFLDLANKYGDDRWPVLEKTCNCGANIMIKGKNFREITNQAWDAEKRLDYMDREGIDIKVLSPIPITFSYMSTYELILIRSQFHNIFCAT